MLDIVEWLEDTEEPERERYSVEFTLPCLTRMNTASSGGHWRNRMREKTRVFSDVGWLTVGKRPRIPLRRARVTIIRRSSGPEPDADNLAQGAKRILDALVHYRILDDDRPEIIGRPDYQWQKAPRGKGEIVVRVEER